MLRSSSRMSGCPVGNVLPAIVGSCFRTSANSAPRPSARPGSPRWAQSPGRRLDRSPTASSRAGQAPVRTPPSCSTRRWTGVRTSLMPPSRPSRTCRHCGRGEHPHLGAPVAFQRPCSPQRLDRLLLRVNEAAVRLARLRHAHELTHTGDRPEPARCRRGRHRVVAVDAADDLAPHLQGEVGAQLEGVVPDLGVGIAHPFRARSSRIAVRTAPCFRVGDYSGVPTTSLAHRCPLEPLPFM